MFGGFLLASLFGLLIGLIAGLIGVGGGEFRTPILIHLLKLPVLEAISANLFIGLVTVIVSFLRRFQLGLLDWHCIIIAVGMSITSVFGAFLGAILTGSFSEKFLKKVLAIFLIIVGFKFLTEPLFEFPIHFNFNLSFELEFSLSLFFGFIIGIISGFFGVAGGEFRIPFLIYVFNLDIVLAGTTSLLVSIPTVASGFLKHRSMGHIDRDSMVIAFVMGFSSIIGALVGASYAVLIGREFLRIILGLVLILATVRMVTKP